MLFLLLSALLICPGTFATTTNYANDEGSRGIIYSPSLSYRSWREQYIAKQLLTDYKYNIRPSGTNESNQKDGGPVIVHTTLRLKSINSINDANMEFASQFRFVQEWTDERMRFDHMGFREIQFVNLAPDQKIWIPDTFFQNEKRGHYHTVDKINTMARVRYDGSIHYNTRLSMTFSCTMDLSRYPHDTQNCVIEFASYAYTTQDIVYEWSDEAVVVDNRSTQMLPKFLILNVSASTCTSKTNTGEYSCLRVELVLKRVFSFFLLQLYIPSIMLVAVSCVSYWIDWKASPARVPLSIVTLLTMITQSHSINASLPPVSYIKAIDLWIGACIVFIFCSLLEYAFVNFTGVREERRKAKNRERERLQGFTIGQEFFANNVPTPTVPSTSSTTATGGFLNAGAICKEMLDTFQGPTDRSPNAGTADSIRRERRTAMVEPVLFADAEALMANRNRRRTLNLCALPFCGYLNKRGKAERIDIVSRVAFPIAFICFNAMYWTLYW